MAEQVTVRAEEVAPVRTRISWGAIFAGALVALAIYVVLTLLGAAIGLTVSGRVRPQDITGGAALWAIATTLIALFCGGCVASQCTVGENRNEAMIYGAVVWGVVFGVFMLVTTSTVRTGFQAIMGAANLGDVAAQNLTPEEFEAAAHRAGMTQAEIDSWKQKMADSAASARATAADQQAQQSATENAAKVAWWAFLGAALSMITAVWGAYVGGGPKFHEWRLNLPSVGVVRRGPAART